MSLRVVGDEDVRTEVGKAIRRLRRATTDPEGRVTTQEPLAERLGVNQGTVSQREKGLSDVPVLTLLAIERALSYDRGTLLRAAGLVVEGVSSVPEAVLADPALDEAKRGTLLNVYRYLAGD